MEQECLHPSWEWGLLEDAWWQQGPAWRLGRCLGAVGESRCGYFLYLLISCWRWRLIRAAAGDDKAAQPQLIGVVLGSAAHGAEAE